MTKIRQYKHIFQLTNLSHDIPNYNLQTTPWTSCTSITCYPNIHNMFCSHFQITTLKHPSGNVYVPKFHLPVTTVTLYNHRLHRPHTKTENWTETPKFEILGHIKLVPQSDTAVTVREAQSVLSTVVLGIVTRDCPGRRKRHRHLGSSWGERR